MVQIKLLVMQRLCSCCDSPECLKLQHNTRGHVQAPQKKKPLAITPQGNIVASSLRVTKDKGSSLFWRLVGFRNSHS